MAVEAIPTEFPIRNGAWSASKGFDPEDQDEQAEKERQRRLIAAFDAAHAQYLAVIAKLAENNSDETCDALCEERDDLLWELIRKRAPIRRQQSAKFSMLRHLMGTPWTDGRSFALLESIRADVGADCNEDGI